jgi:hypothetical protein
MTANDAVIISDLNKISSENLLLFTIEIMKYTRFNSNVCMFIILPPIDSLNNKQEITQSLTSIIGPKREISVIHV